jgi:uncharacterized membrane protein YeaQ/YmgE (transglycosylase-associated protein family)
MDIMNWLAWIIFGGLAGWIASIVMKANASMGLLANIVVGIIGAFVGGFVFNLLGGSGVTGFNLYSLVVAVIGSIVLLWLMRIFTSRRV